MALLSLMIFSCTDSEEVEILKDVKITVQPSTVLSSFAGYNSGDLDMLSDEDGDAKLRIAAYIYDIEGNLVTSKSTLLDDYSSDYVFTLNALDVTKKYRMIVVSNAIQGTLTSPQYEAYSIKNTENIEKLTIFQESFVSLGSNWSILGLGYLDVIPEEESSYTLKLQPGSAMFIHYWNNIHALDSWNVDTYQFFFHNNDKFNYSGEFSPSTTLAEKIFSYVYIPVFYNDESDYYEIYNLLPSKSMNFFGRLFIGEDSEDFGIGAMEVKAGHTYEVEYDCSKLEISVNTVSSGSSAGSRNIERSKRIYGKQIQTNRQARVMDLIK